MGGSSWFEGWGASALGWNDLWLAQAWISVPSTEKCSSDIRAWTRGWLMIAARNCRATSPSSSRSRFLLNVLASPHRRIHRQPTNQRKKQVVVQLLYELTFGAEPEEGLQQQCAQQLLRRDRRAALRRYTACRNWAESTSNASSTIARIHPQRMIRRHPRLAAYVAEQTFRLNIRPAHPRSSPVPEETES